MVGRPNLTVAKVISYNPETKKTNIHMYGPMTPKKGKITYKAEYIVHGRFVICESDPEDGAIPATCEVDPYRLYLARHLVEGKTDYSVTFGTDILARMEAQAYWLHHDPMAAYACTAVEFGQLPVTDPQRSLWEACTQQAAVDTSVLDCMRDIQHFDGNNSRE